MQTVISPIGFDTTSVTRTLMNHGLDSDDTVILLQPASATEDTRATDAVADIEQLLQEIDPTISLQIATLPHDDFETAVLDCSELIRSAEGQLIVSLSGGARDVLLPLTIASVAHSDLIGITYRFSDIDRNVRELLIPNVTSNTSKGAQKTLSAIVDNDGEISVPNLTEHVDAVKSTVTRHVNALESTGYIKTETVNRTKHVSVTLSGKLYIATQGTV